MILVVAAGLAAGLFCGGCREREPAAGQMVGQFPSPMADGIRAHERVKAERLEGIRFKVEGVLGRPVEVYAVKGVSEVDRVDMLIHFHGASYIAEQAVYSQERPMVVAAVNLGSGSSVYEKPFADEAVFAQLAAAIMEGVSEKAGRKVTAGRVYLSSFSAGYGAVRAILKDQTEMVDGVLLLDGLHTDYVPPRVVLAKGGKLNGEKMKGFVRFAKMAAAGDKRMVITHSEIFPGTYASTTETADYIISEVGLERKAVLRWGPGGMQQTSDTRKGGLEILGFAGNSAQDHMDHLHGLGAFLRMLLQDSGE